MRLITLLLLVTLIFTSCKSTKNGNCDAYSQKDIKKDHQI